MCEGERLRQACFHLRPTTRGRLGLLYLIHRTLVIRVVRVNMWGTSSPGDKLTGDLANEPDATSISDRGLFCLLAGNLSPGVFRLLQQNLPLRDSCSAAKGNSFSMRLSAPRGAAEPRDSTAKIKAAPRSGGAAMASRATYPRAFLTRSSVNGACRKRTPVSAMRAFDTAGVISGVAICPTPVGGLSVWITSTCIGGTSLLRDTT